MTARLGQGTDSPCTTAALRDLSVPAHVADLVLGDELDNAELVRVGDRTECDLYRLATRIGPRPAWAIAAFAHDSWSTARRCDPGPFTTTRLLVQRRQDTGRHKHDLDAELAQLDAHPVLSQLTGTLLAASLDTVVLKQLLAPHPHALAADGSSTTATIGLWAPGWPKELGGAPMPNESMRFVSIQATHAGWRDRRVRRLAQMAIWAREQWVDPEPYREMADMRTCRSTI
jgi:hypothetical protein